MKKIVFVAICVCLLLLSCRRNKSQDSSHIEVEFIDANREGNDYVKCWINDSLYFSGLYRTTYDSVWDTYFNTSTAEFIPQEDSAKIQIRVISLDSVLFGNKRIMDTIFHYKVKNIPAIKVIIQRPYEEFRVYDIVNNVDVFTLGG